MVTLMNVKTELLERREDRPALLTRVKVAVEMERMSLGELLFYALMGDGETLLQGNA